MEKDIITFILYILHLTSNSYLIEESSHEKQTILKHVENMIAVIFLVDQDALIHHTIKATQRGKTFVCSFFAALCVYVLRSTVHYSIIFLNILLVSNSFIMMFHVKSFFYGIIIFSILGTYIIQYQHAPK
ncbi:unnamed protein product, partial [Meganyctiphanes norvegica]